MSQDWGSWERKRHFWHLSILWFGLRNRSLEFGPDYSGGTRESIPGISWESDHLLASLLPGISSSGHPLPTSILSPPPPASFGASFKLSAADSCFVSSCKRVNVILGFPSSFAAPHSFPSGGGGVCVLQSPSTQKRSLQPFKTRDSSQGGR